MGAIISLIYFGIVVLALVSYWKLYVKAGKQGWEGIVPIYNMVILMDIVGKPRWWVILMFIPIVNFVVLIMVMHQLSLSFGKDTGFTVGLVLLGIVFIPILAFGDAVYLGPGGKGAAPAGTGANTLDADMAK